MSEDKTRPLWPRNVRRPDGDAFAFDGLDRERRAEAHRQAGDLRDEIKASESLGDPAQGNPVPAAAGSVTERYETAARPDLEDALDERLRTMTMAERVWLEAGIAERRQAGFTSDYDPLAYQPGAYDPLPMGLAPDGIDNWGREMTRPAPVAAGSRSRGWYK